MFWVSLVNQCVCELLVTCSWRLFSPSDGLQAFFLKPSLLFITPAVPSSPAQASASSAAHNDIQSVQEKKKTGGGEYFPLIYTEAELAENSAQGWVEGEPKSKFVMHGHTLPWGGASQHSSQSRQRSFAGFVCAPKASSFPTYYYRHANTPPQSGVNLILK